MLQIDHTYEFLSQTIFKDFLTIFLPSGFLPKNITGDILDDLHVFNENKNKKIFLYDQEPVLSNFIDPYLDNGKLTVQLDALVTSEKSDLVDNICQRNQIKSLYYFFHGFAALDWYRGFHALNYNKLIVKQYNYDFITFNRIITNDRSYRIYWISKLAELGLLDRGQVSFNVTDNIFDDWRDEVANSETKLSEHARQHIENYLTSIDKIIIDRAELPGSASADIPRSADAFWHVVTETVFYYEKLHLTEKIFKPIVSKQPFMLLAAAGNLAYLRSYGFKTFGSVIDETYDTIADNDARVNAVVNQLHWYCGLSSQDKFEIIKDLEPIIQHNFDHFYGEFRHIITKELLDNSKTLFKDIGYNDSDIDYTNIYHVMTR